jgi:hypothetical protein
MSAIDVVWTRMKASAPQYAAQDGIVSASRARLLVVQYLREAAVDPWPPADVIEFFANEFVEMIEARKELLETAS